MSGILSWIGDQFSSQNLFQTVAFILVLLISLPTLMLDRIVGWFDTHKKIKLKNLEQVVIVRGGHAEKVVDDGILGDYLHDYNTAKFVQKRTRRPEVWPDPHVEYHLRDGTRTVVYVIGEEFDVTRLDRKGKPVVTYWARNRELLQALRSLEQGD